MRLRRVRTIGATRLGIVNEWILSVCFVLGPLAILERGFGLDAPASAQVIILAIGIPLSVMGLRLVRAYMPRGERLEVDVSKEQLVFRRQGQAPAVVRRGEVGLVVLSDDPIQGVRQIRVHDHLSNDIGTWDTAWLGRQPHLVKRILTGLGYPCAIAGELYDGRFLAQTPGRPPRLERPAATKEDGHGRR